MCVITDPENSLLRNVRHHKVRAMIADAFRNLKWETYEEISCRPISEVGSTRRVDLIAIQPERKFAMIIDPTIRMESTSGQAADVDNEKKQIYEPCIPDLSKKCNISNWKVVGLLIGARAAVHNFCMIFLLNIKLPLSLLKSICTSVLKDSIHILRNHLYS